MTENNPTSSANLAADLTEDSAPGMAQAGTTEFKTVKAGCGIRFDPDSLDDEAGFDFSAARALKPDPAESEHNPGENSET